MYNELIETKHIQELYIMKFTKECIQKIENIRLIVNDEENKIEIYGSSDDTVRPCGFAFVGNSKVSKAAYSFKSLEALYNWANAYHASQIDALQKKAEEKKEKILMN